MEAKKHYEKYWNSKKSQEQFFGYERNWLLPEFFQKGEYVLDLGAGDGAVAEYLQNNVGATVEGFDISEKAASVAKKRGIKVTVGDVEKKLPYKDKTFDVVFWGDNVEHLFEPEKTLLEIKRILKPKGRLVISCPNLGYWRYRLHFLIHGSLPDTEWSGNKPWGWSHIRFFNPTIMKAFLRSNGFSIGRIDGVNKRFIDKYLAKNSPDLFGMIMLVEASKNG